MFSRKNTERVNMSHKVHSWATYCMKMNEYMHPMESVCVRRLLLVSAFWVVCTSSVLKFGGEDVTLEMRLRLDCAKEWKMNVSWHKVLPTCMCVEGAFSMRSQLHPNPPFYSESFQHKGSSLGHG